MQYRIQTNTIGRNGRIVFERPVWCENRYTAVAAMRGAVSDAVNSYAGDDGRIDSARLQVALCDAEKSINAEHLTVEVYDKRISFDVYH